MSRSSSVENGDQIVDNDPRTRNGDKERIGIIHVVGRTVAKVHWPDTNRYSEIALERIHDDGKSRRTGFTLRKKGQVELLPTSSEDVPT